MRKHLAACRSGASLEPEALRTCTYTGYGDRFKPCRQESPAIADKPARRESLPKIAPIRRAYNVVGLSLTILAYLHSFSCCCVRNLRNPAKFTKNSNLWSSRSSKFIDLGVNGKPICDFILVINSNFSRICYRFRDIYC